MKRSQFCRLPGLCRALAGVLFLFAPALGSSAASAVQTPPSYQTDSARPGLVMQFAQRRDGRGRGRGRGERRARPERRRDDPDRQRRPRRRSDQDRARDAVRRGDVLPLGAIIGQARAYCPGTFLGASLQGGRRGYTYNVTILRPSGRRVRLRLDGSTGEVVGGRCR